jgi:hypothetical protein
MYNVSVYKIYNEQNICRHYVKLPTTTSLFHLLFLFHILLQYYYYLYIHLYLYIITISCCSSYLFYFPFLQHTFFQ